MTDRTFQKNLVTIVMPNYNGELYVADAIESVINQEYSDWELLITDDFSNDNSVAIIKEYQEKDERIKLFKNQFEKGPAGARNTSLQHSSGQCVAFLDNDDIWYPFHLKEMIGFMQDNGHVFAFSWYDYIVEDGTRVGSFTPNVEHQDYKSTLKHCFISCLAGIYNQEEIGPLRMPNLKRRQDYAFWLQILRRGILAYLYPRVTCAYRLRKNTVSSNKFKVLRYNWMVYKKVENLGLFKAAYYLTYYIIYYLINKSKYLVYRAK